MAFYEAGIKHTREKLVDYAGWMIANKAESGYADLSQEKKDLIDDVAATALTSEEYCPNSFTYPTT